MPQTSAEILQLIQKQKDAEGALRNLTNRFSSWSAKTTGTPQYWWAKAGQLRAFVDHMLSHGETSPLFFHSGSAAEYYWRPLHRLLSDYFREKNVPAYANACRCIQQGRKVMGSDKRIVHKALLSAPQVINRFFALRTESWFNNVLKPVFGIDA